MFIPRPNKILEALKNNRIPLGMQMYTHAPDLIEIVGYTGFDWVLIDMEHSRVNPETLEHCIRAAQASGLTPLVRVLENNTGLIRQALEAGAQGIFVPHVKNKEDCRYALDAMRYPPQGKAGICPSIRAANYSQAGWEEYMAFSNHNTMFIPLLEDVEAINNAEEIIQTLTPGRDAIGLGMADITNSLLKEEGEKVQWQHPYTREAAEKVKRITVEAGIPLVGMAWPETNLECARAAVENNTKVLLFYPDQHYWRQICEGIIQSMQGLKQ